MRIAVPSHKGDIYKSCANSRQFTIFEVEDERVVNIEKRYSFIKKPEAVASLLAEYNVSVLICNDIGSRTRKAIREAHIELIPCVVGEVNDAVIRYLSGERIGVPEYMYTCFNDED